MSLPPAVTVHGPEHARAALAPGLPVLLLSGPGAGCTAGAGWWRALMVLAGAGADALDCGDAPGRALEALHLGCRIVVLAPCPAWDAVRERAGGALLLPVRPASLDLGPPGAARRLHRWLQRDSTAGLG